MPIERDRVEALPAGAEVAVVGEADLHAVLEARLRHAPAGELGLVGGERDPHGADAVAGGGVQHEAAPAAADVEQALALPQPELRADQLALGQLGVLQRRGAAREERAGVGHRGVEEQLEEVVGDVVVVAHRARVARAAVAGAPRAQLAGGDPRGARQAARPHRGERQAQARGAVDRGRVEAVEQPDHAVEVVGLQLARGVRAAEAQLPGSAQQVRHGGGRAHREDGAVGRGRGELRAVPEAQREGALGERRRELAAQRLSAGERHRRRRGRVGVRLSSRSRMACASKCCWAPGAITGRARGC